MQVLRRPRQGAEASPEFLAALFGALQQEGVEPGQLFVVGAKPASEARARRTDPETSHQAARSITEGELRASQRDVLRVFRDFRTRPLTDEELIRAYRLGVEAGLVRAQSDSGLRSRRAELVAAGFLVDTGQKGKTRNGGSAIKWGLAPVYGEQQSLLGGER